MAGSKLFKMFAVIAFATLAFAGCSDDTAPTPVAPAPVPDEAPPAAPTGLSAALYFETASVMLSWDANVVDADLAGYHVTRTVKGETVELTMWPHPLTTYNDLEAKRGLNVYSVVAIDLAGNRSAASTTRIDVVPIAELP